MPGRPQVAEPYYCMVESAVWDSLDGTILITTKWTGVDAKPVRMLVLNIPTLKSAQGFVYDLGWGTITVEDRRAKPSEPDLPY